MIWENLLSKGIDFVVNRANQNYTYGLNERAADRADQRTRALFTDLQSIPAQVQQVKDAGMSPAVFYGAGGAGGVTQGAQAEAPAPATFSADIAQAKLMQAQEDLAKAQARNLDADTENKKEETPFIGSKRTAEIAQILADAGNKEASTALMEEEKTGQQLANYVKSKSADFEIKQAEELANKLLWEAQTMEYHTRSAKVQAVVDEKTQDELIKERSNRNKEIAANIALKAAQKELAEQQKSLTDAQESAITSQTNILWGELEVHQTEAEAARTNAATNRIAMWNQANQFTENLKLEYKKLGVELDKATLDAITKVAAATLVAASRAL